MKLLKWGNIRLVLIAMAVVFLYSFSGKRNEMRKLKACEVIFTDSSNLFVTREVVNKLLIENDLPANRVTKDKVDLNELEKSINKHLMIEKSEVFVSVDGVLKAVVQQKTPIARVVGESETFYLDNKGNRMPLSENFSARVPIVTGSVTPDKFAPLAEMFRMVHADDFLRKNIIGAQVSPTGSVKMTSRNHAYAIDFGKMINMERKFGNYKAFYQKAAADSTINAYKTINLKFTSQVVCTK